LDVLSSRSATTLRLDARDTSERTRVGLDYRWRGIGFVDAIDAVVYSQTSNSYQYTFETVTRPSTAPASMSSTPPSPAPTST
jgi:hypothetical protein